MKSVSKKVAIIVITIVLIIGISGGVFAYLFFATDTFKDEQELFFNYLSQNLEKTKELTNLKTIENYQTIKSGETYEENNTINIKYAEGGEISNPYNNLSITLKNQKDNDYNYKDFKIAFEEQNAIQIEGIQTGGTYGIRFSNLLRQFTTLLNGEKIDGLDVDDETLEMMKAIIIDDSSYFQNMIISKQELQNLENKYISVITQALRQGTFSKQSKVPITIESENIETNTYSVDLSAYQFQNLLIELLNNLKIDEIIIGKIEAISGSSQNYLNTIDNLIRQIESKDFKPVKITVYVNSGNTVRTELKSDDFTATIENSVDNGNGNIVIEYANANNETETLNISKQLNELQENYNITYNVANNEEEYEYSLTLESDFERTDISIGYKKDIIEIEVLLENDIITSVGEHVELTSENSINLNETEEPNLSVTLNALNVQVPEKLKSRYDLLIQKLQAQDFLNKVKEKYNLIFGEETENEPSEPIEQDPNITGEQEPTSEADDLTTAEVNRFNAMFEFYSGTGIAGNNVKQLIEITKDHLESVNIVPIENENNKEEITLNIKLNTANAELGDSIIEKIDEQKKYVVNMTFSETNGILQTITIKEQKN